MQLTFIYVKVYHLILVYISKVLAYRNSNIDLCFNTLLELQILNLIPIIASFQFWKTVMKNETL